MNGHEGFKHSTHVPPQVPLPNEIPPPPDLSAIPAHIVHSGTVETLIGQNDDLMARLKVNIRRNSILEQQIMENERTTVELNQANQSLMAQIQLLQEKELRWKDKLSQLDGKENTYKALELKNNQLSSLLRRESAYKRRVQAWVRPLIDRLQDQLQSERLRANDSQKKLAERDATIGDLRGRLGDMIEHMQDRNKAHMRDQAVLVEQYEKKQKTLETNLQRAMIEMKELKDQATKHHQDTRQIALEKADYDLKLRESETALACKNDELESLQNQFKALNKIWAEAQEKLESNRSERDALNRLNLELSKKVMELQSRVTSQTNMVQAEIPKMALADMTFLAEGSNATTNSDNGSAPEATL